MCIDLSLLPRLTRTSFKWCSGHWPGLSPIITVGLRSIILHSDAGNSILTFSSLLAPVSLVCLHAQQASHWLIFGVDIACYLHTTHREIQSFLHPLYLYALHSCQHSRDPLIQPPDCLVFLPLPPRANTSTSKALCVCCAFSLSG